MSENEPELAEPFGDVCMSQEPIGLCPFCRQEVYGGALHCCPIRGGVELDYRDLLPMPNLTSRAEPLAEEHWSYISDLLGVHDVGDEMIEAIRFHYIRAFIHGYKHGLEDAQNETFIYSGRV